jgi:hypothetical protein
VEWKVLTTAPDQLSAEMWQELLQAEGITAIIEPKDAVSFLGVSSMPCRLMVPEEMLERAEAILSEFHVDEV